jgi:hypothetical protein
MIRFLLRLVSLLLLAAAFASAVIDGTRTIAAGEPSWTALGDACAHVFPQGYPVFRAALQSRAPLWLWDPVIVDVLRMPTWIVLAVVGLVLLRASKKRKPPIGYSPRD